MYSRRATHPTEAVHRGTCLDDPPSRAIPDRESTKNSSGCAMVRIRWHLTHQGCEGLRALLCSLCRTGGLRGERIFAVEGFGEFRGGRNPWRSHVECIWDRVLRWQRQCWCTTALLIPDDAPAVGGHMIDRGKCRLSMYFFAAQAEDLCRDTGWSLALV